MFGIVAELLLGMILAAYWGRVLRMAFKARRRMGRAANFVPGETTGRRLRVIWVPGVIVWVAGPWIAALVLKLPTAFRPLYFDGWIAWAATVIAGLCLYLSTRCWKTMGRDWRMGIDPAEKNPLITSGPFAYVRHPIYALSGIMMLATIAAVPSPLMIAAGVAHLVLLKWESKREENHMRKIHGHKYDLYCRTTGGFVPRFSVARAARP